MSELLTTKQIQDLLKIDRITVYRMLNDGRLKGVKIGNQWRFPQTEIDRLMGAEPEKNASEAEEDFLTDFPSDCVEKVQEIYAGIIGIGAVTVSRQGDPLTQPTCCNSFCKLMLASESGRRACQATWRKVAVVPNGDPPIQVCHAGLNYKRSLITSDGQPVAWLIGGQFYTSEPDPEKEEEHLQKLSEKHAIPLDQLKEAARKIPVLKKYQQEKVMEWTPKVAGTVQSILCERSGLMNRLQRIAEISSIRPAIKS